MPSEGRIVYNNKSSTFSNTESCIILDDHKGFYPFTMHYDWVTALGFSPTGELQGFNLTDNQIQNPNTYNENCLWLNGTMHSLPPITIARPHGVDQTWIIKDHHNQVDLTFTPLADVPVKISFGISLVDYHGPTGKFTGHIIDKGSNPVPVSSTHLTLPTKRTE